MILCTRMDRLDPVKESAEYAALDKTVLQLAGQMEAALPESAVTLLNEFRDCSTNMAALAMEMYYRQGFADGIRMIAVGGDGTYWEDEAGEQGR